jgi:dipeptidyl aminopeptidase/acylaminoacyl peptidase
MTALKDHPRTDPEILIEEARQRTRRRRRRGAGLVAVAALVAAGLCLLITHRAGETGADAASASATPGFIASPPADAIAFAKATSDSVNTRIEIAYVPATGGPVVALTDAWKHKMIASDPTWSSDGSQIAFVMSPRGHLTRYAGDGDIYVMNADGTHIRKLTHGLAASAPSWSPAGSRIAFIEGQGQALATIKVDGTHQHIIAHGRGYYESPAWSPNGRSVAYDSGPYWGRYAIYTIRRNGTGERRLTPPAALASEPAWSPNGARIAYSSRDAIWSIDTNGTGPRRITTCRRPCMSDAEPAWSPTGSKLVFVREQGHRLSRHHYFASYRLDVVQLSTGGMRPLTPKIRMASAPDWRP